MPSLFSAFSSNTLIGKLPAELDRYVGRHRSTYQTKFHSFYFWNFEAPLKLAIIDLLN
jgi:hypothetical protein